MPTEQVRHARFEKAEVWKATKHEGGGEMSINDLDKLAAIVKKERDALLMRWRQQVRQLPSARQLDVPTLNDHIPSLLDELATALQSRSDQTIPEALSEVSPPAHGLQRLQDAFDIEEVVAEYNILRGCIHDLAEDNGLNLQGKPFHIINRVLDHAIGLALQTYATQRALDVQRRREEYLAFVAHDLRTPLNAISLAGRVLELKLPPQGTTAEIAQMLKALRRNVKHLDGLVGKVLEENTSLQTEIGIKLERREFDLWPLVEALIHDLHPVAGTASTQLLNRVSDDLVVYADASLLRRVFQNLIANAIRYTPRGEIVIGARECGPECAVECWVSDNGAGISEEFLEKIFNKGETDPENPDRTGLGLAIVKTFTEAHGGTVTVESKEGVGSTFRFSVPTRTKTNVSGPKGR
jgi:two-component system, OmpR family, phosphate regulon sensor histidine kinase PhoR